MKKKQCCFGKIPIEKYYFILYMCGKITQLRTGVLYTKFLFACYLYVYRDSSVTYMYL